MRRYVFGEQTDKLLRTRQASEGFFNERFVIVSRGLPKGFTGRAFSEQATQKRIRPTLYRGEPGEQIIQVVELGIVGQRKNRQALKMVEPLCGPFEQFSPGQWRGYGGCKGKGEVVVARICAGHDDTGPGVLVTDISLEYKSPDVAAQIKVQPFIPQHPLARAQ